MKKKKAKGYKNKKSKHIKNLSRDSFYTYQGYKYNPQTEIGIQGAYGSQGERDYNNTYTE